MKLRTTVQLSGAITSTIQKSKPTLKREDSFLKRFSTRQMPELQETVDPCEDSDAPSGRVSCVMSRLGWKNHRKRRKNSRTPCTVVNTDGNFYYCWLFFVSISVLYNLWTLIVRQAFPELQEYQEDFWSSMDIITDIVFLLDIGVQFRTGYLEQGLMVYDSKKLAGHYIKTKNFLLDLLALFPLDLIQRNTGVKPILRFPRFLKIYRVYNYYYIVESRTVYPNVWRVVNLIHILLILAHWFGCFYYLLSEAEGFQGDWVYPYRPGDYASLSRKYLGSLYWSTLTLTTIGDLPTPETNKHPRTGSLQSLLMRGHKSRLLQFNSNIGYIFTIVSYLIGVFIFATIVGQVGNVITNRNANRLEFERLLDGAKTYMRHHKVPGGMKRRILRWYDYSWSRGRIQGGGDINTALGLLPDKLKTELALHVNLSVLKKVTIFQKCQPEFLHDLVLKMKAYIFTPGDLICRKGEVAREMFIIADGILEVMSETGRVLTTMQAGDFFGEIGILNLDGLNKRTADVRSVGYSELFSLSREDVLAAMKDYPEAQVILQNFGRQRLTEARNLNRAWKLSAQQKKEKGVTATVRIESETDSSKRSIVEKITGDVKELKNVFRKSTRAKSDCMELEPTKSQDKEPKENIGKAVLCRVPCIHNDDMSQDEESPAPQKIGAGLPLFQRLKLLKEKQEQEQLKSESKDSSSSFIPEEEKKNKENDSVGMPLLQRILLMKQKDEKKAGVVQTTANMAAEVLASTVRTQITSPTQLTLKSNLKYENNDDPKLDKKILTEANKRKTSNKFKEKLMGELERSGTHFQSPYMPDSTVDAITERKNHYESDNESWILIKKAVLVPNNSMDLHEKRLTDIKLKHYEKPETDQVSSISKNPDNLKCMMDEESKLDEAMGGIMEEPENVNTVVRSSPASPYHSTASKTYESIDDLSPEYSGLPFVKKLKILNERQKLAELEKGKTTDVYNSHHPRPPPIDCSEGQYQSYESPLMSPESNETLERRKLKSILKKLSSASTAQSGESSSSEISNIIRKKSTSEMRKLLRAQTVEGYAARHSKFTKSVTFNHESVDLETSSTESVSAQIGTDRLVENNVESSETNRDKQTCSNVKNVSLQTDRNQNEDVTGEVSNTVASSDSVSSVFKSVQKWEATQEATSSEGQGEKDSGGAAFVNIQREIITTIFEEIRKAIDEHLGNIESKYVTQYIRLQLEVKRRDDLIMDLQRRLSELEDGPVRMLLSEDEDDEEEISYYDHQSAGTPSVSYRDLSKSLSESQSHSQSESTIIRIESDDSTDEDEVFFSNQTDWEIHLLAEELEKRERTRRRAISFDVSQLQPRPTIDELSEHEETESSLYEGESAPRPEEDRNLEENENSYCPTIYMTRRSLSANSIQTQISRRIVHRKHYSLNGMEYEDSTLTRRPIKTSSNETMK